MELPDTLVATPFEKRDGLVLLLFGERPVGLHPLRFCERSLESLEAPTLENNGRESQRATRQEDV